MKFKTRDLMLSIVLIIISILFTVAVKLFDVSAIGPNDSLVGFSHVNQAFNDFVGSNLLWYTITWWAGNVAILIMLVYAIVGLVELIKFKSFKKIDKEIIILGGFYVLVLAIYVLFEKVIINYRPVLIEGMLEASYPSSHTMLAIFTCLSSVIINNKLFKNKVTKVINVLVIMLMLLIVVGRIISGVHWLTDIIGGITIAGTLVCLYYTIIDALPKGEE